MKKQRPQSDNERARRLLSQNQPGPSNRAGRRGLESNVGLGEEEISDVSLGTFYVFDKENEPHRPRHKSCGQKRRWVRRRQGLRRRQRLRRRQKLRQRLQRLRQRLRRRLQRLRERLRLRRLEWLRRLRRLRRRLRALLAMDARGLGEDLLTGDVWRVCSSSEYSAAPPKAGP